MTRIGISVSPPVGLAALALVSVVPIAALAQAPSSFYAGKQIDLIIGSSPGGGYDIYARLLARYMDRHIPGKPSIVPRNMPGAGSNKAASFLYTVGAEGR